VADDVGVAKRSGVGSFDLVARNEGAAYHQVSPWRVGAVAMCGEVTVTSVIALVSVDRSGATWNGVFRTDCTTRSRSDRGAKRTGHQVDPAGGSPKT
jgi:hypothetical protein